MRMGETSRSWISKPLSINLHVPNMVCDGISPVGRPYLREVLPEIQQMTLEINRSDPTRLMEVSLVQRSRGSGTRDDARASSSSVWGILGNVPGLVSPLLRDSFPSLIVAGIGGSACNRIYDPCLLVPRWFTWLPIDCSRL